MEEKRLRLRTYRQVWQLEQVIYQIERVPLPFPVTFRQIGIFTATLLAMVVVSSIPAVEIIPPLLRYLLLPGFAAWYLSSRRLDGKLPHRWVMTMARYWLSPKALFRLRPITDPQRIKVAARVSYRVKATSENPPEGREG